MKNKIEKVISVNTNIALLGEIGSGNSRKVESKKDTKKTN